MENARMLAIEALDVDLFGVQGIRAVFRQQELDEIRAGIREEVLPNLSDRISAQESEQDESNDPEDTFHWLTEAFEVWNAEFEGDSEARAMIEAARTEVDETIERLREEYYSPEEDSGYYSGGELKVWSLRRPERL